MPVRVNCPHCLTPCLVAEQHLGVPVQCGRCARTFTTPPAVAANPSIVLDVAAATSLQRGRARADECFLVQQASWCNLDERHELALILIADGATLRAASAALLPLLGKCMNRTSQEFTASLEPLAEACKNFGTAVVILIGDSEVRVLRAGTWHIHHQRGGRLMPADRPLKLIAGDWILVTCGGLDLSEMQAEIGQSARSADQRARQLARGGAKRTVLVVRCS